MNFALFFPEVLAGVGFLNVLLPCLAAMDATTGLDVDSNCVDVGVTGFNVGAIGLIVGATGVKVGVVPFGVVV